MTEEDWHTSKYWDSKRACAYLGITPNNLGQIRSRMARGHLLARHSDNGKCSCLLVDHKGHKTNWYLRSKVEGYALYRKGAPSEVAQIMALSRKAEKVSQGKKKTRGRPINQIGR